MLKLLNVYFIPMVLEVNYDKLHDVLFSGLQGTWASELPGKIQEETRTQNTKSWEKIWVWYLKECFGVC